MVYKCVFDVAYNKRYDHALVFAQFARRLSKKKWYQNHHKYEHEHLEYFSFLSLPKSVNQVMP